jgi:hypothetical protein
MKEMSWSLSAIPAFTPCCTILVRKEVTSFPSKRGALEDRADGMGARRTFGVAVVNMVERYEGKVKIGV